VRGRRLFLWAAAGLAVSALAVSVLGQAPTKTWTPPQTPDGQPDLSGYWTNITLTPLQRPANLAGKPFFTPAEAAAYEKETVERNNADRRDPGTDADVGKAYNDFWWDRGTKVVSTLRTSLIIDPPDGKVPELSQEANRRMAETRAAARGHAFDGPENRGLSERCLLWPTAGPPMMPSFYNNNYQIVQGPGYVTIVVEMIHDARIIPLDGRPHLPQNVRLWLGDSRGHWEGNTLVVETTNFTDKTPFQGSGKDMRLVERFTRTAPDTILYQFTVNDPATFAKPWTAEIPMRQAAGPLIEYACHEGNYAMTGILSGARADEKKAAEGAK
jgi:hypothetical protein